jgi:ketosteroid isomerase-like protein
MTSTADPAARDRLGPWIDALRGRVDRVRPRAAATASRLLVEQLAALASADIQRVGASLAPDVVVRAWGAVPGGHWSWNGESSRHALDAFVAALPVAIRTARVDIDRFFPGGDVVGFDGDLSWLATGAALGRRSAPDSTYLVGRRVAAFATYRDRVLTELDVYVDVHETVALSDGGVNDRSG